MLAIRRSANLLLVIFMIAVFTECKADRNIPKGYSIVCAKSFSVIEFTSDNPNGRAIYQLDQTGDTIITAVSYNAVAKIIAVATTKKEPEKGAAKIVLLKVESASPLTEIALKKYYRIQAMSINNRGEIAFSARGLDRRLREELCYLKNYEVPILITLAESDKILNPSWGKDAKKVYFACHRGTKRIVAYTELGKPGVIRQIDEGVSITLSKSGKLAYLKANGNIFFMEKLGQTPTLLKLPSKYTDPKFTDSIRFVIGTEEIVIQHYKKSIVYDLLLVKPPYKDASVLIKNAGMQDYYVSSMMKN
jgi:hypothetical protein